MALVHDLLSLPGVASAPCFGCNKSWPIVVCWHWFLADVRVHITYVLLLHNHSYADHGSRVERSGQLPTASKWGCASPYGAWLQLSRPAPLDEVRSQNPPLKPAHDDLPLLGSILLSIHLSRSRVACVYIFVSDLQSLAYSHHTPRWPPSAAAASRPVCSAALAGLALLPGPPGQLACQLLSGGQPLFTL